jgi:hypothetical protein
VESGDHKNGGQSNTQKFYKFSIKGKDAIGNPVTLDPCIICEP